MLLSFSNQTSNVIRYYYLIIFIGIIKSNEKCQKELLNFQYNVNIESLSTTLTFIANKFKFLRLKYTLLLCFCISLSDELFED